MTKLMQATTIAKLGAAAYAVWSLLHFQAAYTTYELGQSMAPSLAQGRVLQDAWNLFAFAVAALSTAVLLNWKNDRLGYWLNVGVVSVTDLGFIAFVLLPGFVPLWPGLVGPIFWWLGLILSTIAIRGRAEERVSQSSALATDQAVSGGQR